MCARTSILKGKTILVTRAGKQAQDLANLLKEHDALTIEIPMIEIGPPSSWKDIDTALGALDSFDWIVFASSNAVSALQNRLAQLGLNLPFDRVRVAAIGSSTAKTLKALGYNADFTPSSFVAEDFVTEFSDSVELKDKRILWPRTNVGRKFISEELSRLGATVVEVESYSTNLPGDADTISERVTGLIVEKQLDVITLASSQTVKNFCHLLRVGVKARFQLSDSELDNAMLHHTKDVVLAAIGPITAETTRSLLGRVDLQAEKFSAEGLVSQLLQFYGTDHA